MDFQRTTQDYLALAKSLKIGLKADFPPPQNAWLQKNVESEGFTTLGTLGNFSLVIGKAKSRKSFFINIAVSAAISKDIVLKRYLGKLPDNRKEVLYFDTEQGEYHVQQALKRICRQTGIKKPKNLHIYHLRTLKPSERRKVIEAVIYDSKNAGFVVIDGIRDLVTSINDEQQATMISSKLLKWSEERNIHIVTVLHQNKSDNNARGHLGTELLNKAETVLSVTKMNGREELSVVESVSCRNKDPEPFAFEIIDNLPTAAEGFLEWRSGKVKSQKLAELAVKSKRELLIRVFNGMETGFKYGRLKELIKSSYEVLFGESIGNNQIVDFITDCKNKGWLLQKEERAPYTLGFSLEDDP